VGRARDQHGDMPYRPRLAEAGHCHARLGSAHWWKTAESCLVAQEALEHSHVA
jgi:hypothetical protein